MVIQQPGRFARHGTSFLEVKDSRFWDSIVSLLILQPKQGLTSITALTNANADNCAIG